MANLSEGIEIIKCLSDIFCRMCKIKHIISVIHYTICGAVCFQFTHFSCDDWENIYTLSYYHHQIRSMNYHPLFRVRSWNSGVRCMPFYILMVMNYPLLFNVNYSSPVPEIRLFQNLTLKIQGQGHGRGQTHWLHLKAGIQSICLLFISWQLDHFWLRYGKFHIWPWKFKVKVMAKVKSIGHIQDLEINRYVNAFRFEATIFGWVTANSIFDLENSRSRSQRKSTKILSGNLQVKVINPTKNERNPKSCSEVVAWPKVSSGSGVWIGTKM